MRGDGTAEAGSVRPHVIITSEVSRIKISAHTLQINPTHIEEVRTQSVTRFPRMSLSEDQAIEEIVRAVRVYWTKDSKWE